MQRSEAFLFLLRPSASDEECRRDFCRVDANALSTMAKLTELARGCRWAVAMGIRGAGSIASHFVTGARKDAVELALHVGITAVALRQTERERLAVRRDVGIRGAAVVWHRTHPANEALGCWRTIALGIAVNLRHA